MQTSRSRGLGAAVVGWDHSLTRLMNKSCALKGVRPFFAAISWMGNGKLWYNLMWLLPVLFGAEGAKASFHMMVVGLVTLAVYKMAKSKTRRARPCSALSEIALGASPLDEYSFPSGHTMHGVAFTVVAVAWFPQLALVLGGFTVLVALSRVILGLHYPTDVFLGAALGFGIAKLSFLFM